MWSANNSCVSVGDTQMDYVSFGHGPKQVVVLPGLSDGLVTVKGKALMLALPYQRYFDRFTIYMFSRKNDLPEGWSLRDMAADQAEAMRQLGIEHASVLGVSEGGMIAQHLAIDDPQLVERLVLTVTAPSANETVQDCVSRWIGFAEQGDHKSLMIDTAEHSYSPAFLKKIRETYPVLGMVGKPKDYKRFLINAHAILRFDVLDEVGRISCPVLIIGGQEDRIVGIAGSHQLHERIADSRLYVYPEFGHGAYEEAKDFYARVFAFLGEESGTGA